MGDFLPYSLFFMGDFLLYSLFFMGDFCSELSRPHFLFARSEKRKGVFEKVWKKMREFLLR